MQRKNIILELKQILKKDQNITDIWLYGSIDDSISDLGSSCSSGISV